MMAHERGESRVPRYGNEIGITSSLDGVKMRVRFCGNDVMSRDTPIRGEEGVVSGFCTIIIPWADPICFFVIVIVIVAVPRIVVSRTICCGQWDLLEWPLYWSLVRHPTRFIGVFPSVKG